MACTSLAGAARGLCPPGRPDWVNLLAPGSARRPRLRARQEGRSLGWRLLPAQHDDSPIIAAPPNGFWSSPQTTTVCLA